MPTASERPSGPLRAAMARDGPNDRGPPICAGLRPVRGGKRCRVAPSAGPIRAGPRLDPTIARSRDGPKTDFTFETIGRFSGICARDGPTVSASAPPRLAWRDGPVSAVYGRRSGQGRGPPSGKVKYIIGLSISDDQPELQSIGIIAFYEIQCGWKSVRPRGSTWIHPH